MDGFTVTNANRFLDTGSLTGTGSFVEKPSIGVDAGKNDGVSFADTLQKAVDEVNQLQKTADRGMQDLATGRADNVADVMIKAEKADIALKVMVQVRNKII